MTTIAPKTNNGTVTSWLPLSTTFSFPPQCTYPYFVEEDDYDALKLDPYLAFVWGDELYGSSTISCIPDAVSSSWDQFYTSASQSITTSLQPFVCPSSYRTISSSVATNLLSTLATCCPSGYAYEADFDFDENNSIYSDGYCYSYVGEGQLITYLYNSSEFGLVSSTTLSTSTHVIASPLLGWNPAPATTTASATASPSTLSTSPTNTSPPPSGLSSGAKAGIGVGVTLAAIIALIIGTSLFLIRRRRKRMLVPDTDSDGTAIAAGKPYKDTDTYELGTNREATEMSGSEAFPQELQVVENPAEVDAGGKVAHELPA